MEDYYTEILYDLAIRPGRGFGRAREHRPWLFLVFIVFLSEISIAVGASLSLTNLARMSKFGFFSNLIFTIVLATFFWIINAGILHFSAEVWGKKGKVIDLFLTLGLAMFPFILFTPLSLIAEGLGKGGIFLYPLFTSLILIWYLFLVVSSIREVYASSTFEAVLILLVPIGVFATLLMFISIAYILLMVISLSL